MAAPAAPGPVRCFRCGTSGVWHPGSNAWGCDACRQLIGGPPQFPAPMATNPYQPSPYQGAAPAQVTPKCPRCWGDATFHPQMNQWGCDRCKQLLTAEQVAAAKHAAQGANPADAGVKVLKVVLWIALLIVLVVIKVALRSGHW